MSKRLHQVKACRLAARGVTALELSSNHSFPRHAHDEYGIGVVLSGAQRSWSSIGTVESCPGHVITVNPGELHDGHPINGAVRQWRIIYFEPRVLARLIPDPEREIEFVSPSLPNPNLAERVSLLFDRLTEGADRLGLEEILAQVVPHLMSVRLESSGSKYSGSVTRSLERIEDDPSSPIALSELAALSGVSRYQLVREFSRTIGTTPYAYVIQCRVRLARKLLVNGATLADASHEAGFADQSHMTRAFVRQLGITPGCYRAARI
jgi:AraC-like DNA-binding protein